MKRPLLPLLLLPLFMLATALVAQERFEGRFAFSIAPGSAPFMVIELAQTQDGIVGIGQTTPQMPVYGPSVVTVIDGLSFDGNLQLELELAPFDISARPSRVTFSVIDGRTPPAALISGIGGQPVNGFFLPDGAAARAPAPQDPPPEVPLGTGQVPPVCRELADLTDILNSGADTDIVQIIRGIYTNAGLAFGGEQTPERCSQALFELQSLVIELEEGAAGEGAASCNDLDELLGVVFFEFDARGMIESAELDAILAAAGLQMADLNPNGVWNETNCARAIPPVDAYLARLRAAPPVEPAGANDGIAVQGVAMTVLPVTGFAPVGDANTVELWGHNGSQMVFESGPAGSVAFWYWEPRQGLQQVGVQRGTLLFIGETNGTFVDGFAHLFTANCETYSYRVAGPWFDGASQVTVTGDRPVVDAQCRVTGTEPETLVFDFISFEPEAATPQAQPQPEPQTQPQTQPQPQPQPQTPTRPESTGVPLAPLGEQTMTNNDLIRPADPDDDFGDLPAFGVWGEIYEVYDVSDTLNMRAGPGTEFAVIAELPRFARDILVMGGGCTPDLDQIAFTEMSPARQAEALSTRWCNVDWNGQTGWVFGRYIRPY